MKELQKKIIKEQKKSCKLERLQHNIQKIGMKTEVDIKKSVNTKMLKWKETVKKSTKNFNFSIRKINTYQLNQKNTM